MTKNIENMLNLPSLDDVVKERGVDIEQPNEEKVEQTMASLKDLTNRMAIWEGNDHAEAMDDLYTEIVGHARDLMSYGYNVDMPRQRGIFEIATMMYGHAINTKNSKRDAQLKALRLALDKKKLEMDEQRNGQAATIDNNNIVVEDRNELIRKLKEQMKK
jgi:hypothetical protein